MSDNNRPEWASGPEWEGWTPSKGLFALSMTRQATDGTVCCILEFGSLIAGPHDGDWSDVQYDDPMSPAHALKAANALAEASGGWA